MLFNLAQKYGIFVSNSDASKGTWLENSRTLEYYLLKNGVSMRCYIFSLKFFQLINCKVSLLF